MPNFKRKQWIENLQIDMVEVNIGEDNMTRWREQFNLIKPAIPYISLYDAGGSQTIDGSFLTWDNIKILTSHFLYSEDDNRVQLAINSSGLFEITFDVSLSGGGTSYFEVYKNGTVISESRMYAIESGTLNYTIYLEKDDYIQIKGTLSSGSSSTIANTSRLKIKRLPMLGWDNKRSGRHNEMEIR
jgi:hypothetical protein